VAAGGRYAVKVTGRPCLCLSTLSMCKQIHQLTRVTTNLSTSFNNFLLPCSTPDDNDADEDDDDDDGCIVDLRLFLLHTTITHHTNIHLTDTCCSAHWVSPESTSYVFPQSAKWHSTTLATKNMSDRQQYVLC